MKKRDEKTLAKAFQGKTFVITGAAGGLGSSMARFLAPHWAGALLLDLNAKGLESVAADLPSSAGKVITRKIDLTSDKSIERATAELPGELSPPDMLINNAGISIMKLAEKQPLAEYRKMMDVNYFGAIALVNLFLPGMLERRSGSIMTIASGSGVLANYGGTGYCGSKFAIVGYMESLRQELAGTGVKAHCVLLPTVMTDLHQGVLDGEFGDMAKSLPTISPDEAALRLLLQAAAGREVISFSPTLEAGLLANRLVPSVMRAAMSINGYMLNRRRGRV